MHYYRYASRILVARDELNTGEFTGISEVLERTAVDEKGVLYFIQRQDPGKRRRSFSLSDPSLLSLSGEGIDLLTKGEEPGFDLPAWLMERIHTHRVMAVNISHPKWQEALSYQLPKKWRVNLSGLGDVGGTLLTGLRLLGGELISEIGIFDKDPAKIKRWEFEVNQIRTAFNTAASPDAHPVDEDHIFDCDLFVFCVSVGVPPVGEENQDVRLVQFTGNAKILAGYAQKAREAGFTGVFAVVSDPVDLLCRAAFDAGNLGPDGQPDYRGLAPEQIRGYGLGVMNARAVYYARQDPITHHYEKEGRAFGPHGQGLVIADSIENYDDQLSRLLTDQARLANLEVRSTGFKPYVAPALSSGALSLLATIRGDWHYSATFMGGVFMGAKNRLLPSGVEVERLKLPPALVARLAETYENLRGHSSDLL